MPLQDNDYRLEHHKEYLQGLALHWSLYRQPSATWDHDHCEFCWQRFAEPTSHYTDAEFWGYVASDGAREWWICKTCADDLKGRYEWEVVGGPEQAMER
jgi:hypothetical protein